MQLTERKAHFLAFLLFCALAVLMTYPVIVQMSTHIFVDWDDAIAALWHFAWNGRHMVEGMSGYYHTNILYPAQYTLGYTEHGFGLSLLGTLLLLPWVLKLTPAGLRFSPDHLLVGYNLLILLTFTLSAFGAYLLSYHFTRRKAPSLIAGLVFSYCNYHFGYYHQLSSLSIQWIPFTFLYLHKFFEEGGYRNWLLFTFFFLLNALTCVIYGIMLVPFCGGLILYYVVKQKRFLDRSLWVKFLVFIALNLAIQGPLLYPYSKVRDLLDTHGVLFESVAFAPDLLHFLDFASVNQLFHQIIAYLTRLYQNPELGAVQMAAVKFFRFLHAHEKALFPGFVAVFLTVYGLLPFLGRKGAPAEAEAGPRRLIRGLNVAILVLVVLSLGCWAVGLIFGNLVGLLLALLLFVVRLFVDGRLRRRIRGFFAAMSEYQRIYLIIGLAAFLICLGPMITVLRRPLVPGPAFLMIHIPVLEGLRRTQRFGAVITLALSVLVAYGAARWLSGKRAAGRARLLWVLLFGGVILVENWAVPLPGRRIRTGKDIPAVYTWLAEQEGDFVVAELPLTAPEDMTIDHIPPRWRWAWKVPFATRPDASPWDKRFFNWVRENLPNCLSEYYSIYHRKRLVNGYSALIPQSYITFRDEAEYFPTPASIDTLEELDVKYLILHRMYYGEELWPEVLEAVRGYGDRLALRQDFGEARVYELTETKGGMPPARFAARYTMPLTLAPGRTYLTSVVIRSLHGRDHFFKEKPLLRINVERTDARGRTASERFEVGVPLVVENGGSTPAALFLRSPREEGRYTYRVRVESEILEAPASFRFDVQVSEDVPTRADPDKLGAALRVVSCPSSVFAEQSFRVITEAENTGATRWLARSKSMYAGEIWEGHRQDKVVVKGWKGPDGELRSVEAEEMHQGYNMDFTVGGFLPCDVPPGQTVEVNTLARAPHEPGDYTVCLDLINQCYGLDCWGKRWLTAGEGCALEVPIRVQSRWP